MAYCTNCGKEIQSGICDECGVKNNTIHNYCFWCGEKLSENAAICVKCKEPVKTSNALKTAGCLFSVPCIVLSLLFCIVLLSNKTALGAVIWSLMSAALFIKLPSIHQKFKEYTYNKMDYTKNSTRIIAILCSFFIVFIGILVSLGVSRTINNIATSPTKEERLAQNIIVGTWQATIHKTENDYQFIDSDEFDLRLKFDKNGDTKIIADDIKSPNGLTWKLNEVKSDNYYFDLCIDNKVVYGVVYSDELECIVFGEFLLEKMS